MVLVSAEAAGAGEKCAQDGSTPLYSETQVIYEGITKVSPTDATGRNVSWQCFFHNPAALVEVDPALLLSNGGVAPYSVRDVNLNVDYWQGWTIVTAAFIVVDGGKPTNDLEMHFKVTFDAIPR